MESRPGRAAHGHPAGTPSAQIGSGKRGSGRSAHTQEHPVRAPSRTRRATMSTLLTGLALLGIVLSLPSLAQAEGLFGYQAVTGVAGGSTYWQFVSSSYGGLNGANGGTDYLSFFVDFYSVDRKDSEGARFTVTPYARLLTSPG